MKLGLGFLIAWSSLSFALIHGEVANQWTPEFLLQNKGKPSLREGMFPSVVFLEMGCTGTIVGPRQILLAAHCLVEREEDVRILKKHYLPGSRLRFDSRVQWTRVRSKRKNEITVAEVSVAKRFTSREFLRKKILHVRILGKKLQIVATPNPHPKSIAQVLSDEDEALNLSYSHQVRIVKTFIHPSFFYASSNGNTPNRATDLAVFLVDRDIGVEGVDLTPEQVSQPQRQSSLHDESYLLPIAKIQYEPLNIQKDFVVKMGYGCEDFSATPSSLWRLKWDGQNVPDPADALKRGVTYADEDYQNRHVIDDFYWITKAFHYWTDDEITAQFITSRPATSCPGDSGGPIWSLNLDTNEMAVVGVNSKSRLRKESPDKQVRVAIDFHTRFDSESALRADKWLQRVLSIRKEDGKAWLSGVAFQAFAPRVDEAFLKSKSLKMDVHESLKLSTDTLVVQVNGMDGKPCPYEVKSLSVGAQKLERTGVDLFAKKDRTEFEVHSLSFEFEAVASGEPASPVCFLSAYAKDRLKALPELPSIRKDA